MRLPPSLAVLLFSIASTSCRGITHNHTSHTSARVSVPHKPTVSGTSSVTHKSSAATANRTAPSKRSSGPQPSAKRPPPPPPPAPEEEEDAGDARPALLTIVAVTLAPLCASVSIKALCEDTGEGTTSSWVFACLLITAFLGLNSGLSILNRWALGVHGLRFPLIMTAMHMVRVWELCGSGLYTDAYICAIPSPATCRANSPLCAILTLPPRSCAALCSCLARVRSRR